MKADFQCPAGLAECLGDDCRYYLSLGSLCMWSEEKQARNESALRRATAERISDAMQLVRISDVPGKGETRQEAEYSEAYDGTRKRW